MSWRYRKYRRFGRAYTPKYFFSEKEIDFTTESLDYNQFLLQEFFTMDAVSRDKVFKKYKQKFGSLSLQYLDRKFSDWADGNFHLTEMMKERIISIMPQFLDDSAKHKLGIHEFMASIKKTIKTYQLNQKRTFSYSKRLNSSSEITPFFESEYAKIHDLEIQNFRFNVLTEEEKEEAIEICKYILELKLQIDFDQIERDFRTFLPHMQKYMKGNFSASYSINRFNLTLDISNTGMSELKIPYFKVNDIEGIGRFREYADKFLAFELVAMGKEFKHAIGNSFLNSNDLDLFFLHYTELNDGDSEVKLNSAFNGEGGILKLNLSLKPLKLLKTALIISSMKLTIYIILVIIFVFVTVNNKLFNLLIFGGFVGGLIAFSIINDEIKLLKSLKTEYLSHGK